MADRLTGTQKRHLEMAKKMGMVIPDNVQMKAYNYKTGEEREGLDMMSSRSRSPRPVASSISSPAAQNLISLQAFRTDNKRELLEKERWIREREELKRRQDEEKRQQDQQQKGPAAKMERLGPVQPRQVTSEPVLERLGPVMPREDTSSSLFERMQHAEKATPQAPVEQEEEDDDESDGPDVMEQWRQKMKQQEDERQRQKGKKKRKKKRSSRYDDDSDETSSESLARRQRVHEEQEAKQATQQSSRSDGLMDEAQIKAMMKRDRKVERGSADARQRIEKEQAQWEQRKISAKNNLEENTSRVMAHPRATRY